MRRPSKAFKAGDVPSVFPKRMARGALPFGWCFLWGGKDSGGGNRRLGWLAVELGDPKSCEFTKFHFQFVHTI